MIWLNFVKNTKKDGKIGKLRARSKINWVRLFYGHHKTYNFGHIAIILRPLDVFSSDISISPTDMKGLVGHLSSGLIRRP
jgi:hypothetical protein